MASRSSNTTSRGAEYKLDFELTTQQFKHEPLPAKPKLNTSGKEINLTLNTFPVTKFPDAPVWQYDVSQHILGLVSLTMF